MTDPEIINSKLSRIIEQEGTSVQVSIYRFEHETEWTLEITDEDWNSTVWEDTFPTEEDALAEAIAAINMEGISAFVGEVDDEDEQEDRPLVH